MNCKHYISNRKAITEKMKDGELLIMFAGEEIRKTADEDYPFFANRNFLYLTGIKQDSSILVITKLNDCISEAIYSKMPNEQEEVWTGRRLREEEIVAISGIEDIKYINNFEMDVHKYLVSGKYNDLCLCIDTFKADQDIDLEHKYCKKIKEIYPEIKIKNIYPTICSNRRFKNDYEIEAIKKGMEITNKGIRRIMKAVKPEIMEYQLEAEFNHELGINGQRNTAFPSIISSGKRNFYLHYSSLMGKVEDGDLVLVDVGSPYDDYATDISRMIPANGKFSERQAIIYNLAYKANREVMKQIKPGKPFSICNDTCNKVIFEGLKELGLIEDFKDIKKYAWHGVAHHVGLDTHDVGGYEEAIAENMVFTVDAGIYVRQWGIGLRIEDNILVTKDGIENLSKDIPVTIEEIEDLMK